MNVLVTGATGFIGSHLVNRLVREGSRVIAPVRNAVRSALLAALPVEIAQADLMEQVQIEKLLNGVDVVCHLASIRGSGWSIDDRTVREVNVGITRNLLAASISRGVRHFVYVSSVSVFGHPTGGPVNEDFPCHPVTRYGRTKLESEKLAAKFHGRRGLSVTIVRPVITYGPGDTWGMVGKLTGLVRSKRFATIGTGVNRVHLVYIDDLIEGLLLAMRAHGTAEMRTYILAGAEPISVNALVGYVASALHQRAPRVHVPIRIAGVAASLLEMSHKLLALRREPFVTRDKIDIMSRDRFFDITKARRELGYSPAIGYGEGIQRTVDWLLASMHPASRDLCRDGGVP